jgi:D-aminoacyl-tRNA deacylase
MRVVIQRVRQATVTINGKEKRKISKGLVIFAGFEELDNADDIAWISKKIAGLRIFNDVEGVMNLPIGEINGDIMVISQFTLHASTKKGNRPSYIRAAKPDIAIPLYTGFIDKLSAELQKKIVVGEFGAHMDVELINDGPVTIIIDTKYKE